MDRLFGQLLCSYLGDYVEPEDLRSLKTTGLAARVELHDLHIRPQGLDALNLPLKVRYGVVKRISLQVPGGAGSLLWSGLFGSAYNESIRIEIDGVYLLVDIAAQTPAEVSRRLAAAKRAALDHDVNEYRQYLLDAIQRSLAKAAAAVGGGGVGGAAGVASSSSSSGSSKSLAETLIDNLQVTISNVHVRYEDFESCSAPRRGVGSAAVGPGAMVGGASTAAAARASRVDDEDDDVSTGAFAVGVTFSSLATYPSQIKGGADALPDAHGAAGISGTALATAPAAGLQLRSATLSHLTVYWDSLPPPAWVRQSTSSVAGAAAAATGGGAAASTHTWRAVASAGSFSALLAEAAANPARKAALDAAFHAGIHAEDRTPPHRYILSPEPAGQSPATRLEIELNSKGRVANRPKLLAKLRLAWLQMGLTKRQWQELLRAHARKTDEAYVALQEELARRYRPPPDARGPDLWRGWWGYAARFVQAVRDRSSEAATAPPRWDFTHVRGALAAREQYMTAYRAILEAEYAVILAAAEEDFKRGGYQARAAAGGAGAAAAAASVAAALPSGSSAGAASASGAAPVSDSVAETGDKSARLLLEALERDKLQYEQALQFRAEVRVDFERAKLRELVRERSAAAAAAAAAASAGGGGLLSRAATGLSSWIWGGAPAPAAAAAAPHVAPAAAAGAGAGGGGERPVGEGSMMRSPSDASLSLSRTDAVQETFNRSKQGVSGATELALTAEISQAALALRRGDGSPLLTLRFSGSADFTTGGRSFALGLRLRELEAIDGATRGSAYPVILKRRAVSGPLMLSPTGRGGGMAPATAGAGHFPISASDSAAPATATASSSRRGSTGLALPLHDASDAGAAAVALASGHSTGGSAFSGNKPLLSFHLRTTPGEREAFAISVEAQPLVAVFPPDCVRALTAFSYIPTAQSLGAQALAEAGTAGGAGSGWADGLSERFSSLRSKTASDVYAALASHQRIQLRADIAGPWFVVPADICDASAPRLVLHLGDLKIRSAETTELIAAAPVGGSRDLFPSASLARQVRSRRNSITHAPSSARSSHGASVPQLASTASSTLPSSAIASAATSSAAVPPVETAAAHHVEDPHSFDTWCLTLRNVSMYVQDGVPRDGRRSSTSGSESSAQALFGAGGAAPSGSFVASDFALQARSSSAIIEPITLTLDVQTCFLPSDVARSRVRVQGELHRLCARLSLPFIILMGSIERRLTAMRMGMLNDAAAERRKLLRAHGDLLLDSTGAASATGLRASASSSSLALPRRPSSAAVTAAGGTGAASPAPATPLPSGHLPSARDATATRAATASAAGMSLGHTAAHELAPPVDFGSDAAAWIVDLRIGEVALELLDVRAAAAIMDARRSRQRQAAHVGASADATVADSPVDEDAVVSALRGSGHSGPDLRVSLCGFHAGAQISQSRFAVAMALASVRATDHVQQAGRGFAALIDSAGGEFGDDYDAGVGSAHSDTNTSLVSARSGSSPASVAPVSAAAEGMSSSRSTGRRASLTSASGGGGVLPLQGAEPLIFIAAEYSARSHHHHHVQDAGANARDAHAPAASATEADAPVAVTCRFTNLHINYNPGTVRALQLYGMYLAESLRLADTEVVAAAADSSFSTSSSSTAHHGGGPEGADDESDGDAEDGGAAASVGSSLSSVGAGRSSPVRKHRPAQADAPSTPVTRRGGSSGAAAADAATPADAAPHQGQGANIMRSPSMGTGLGLGGQLTLRAAAVIQGTAGLASPIPPPSPYGSIPGTPVLLHQPGDGAAGASPPAASLAAHHHPALRVQLTFDVRRVTVSLNNEQRRRKVALLGVAGLSLRIKEWSDRVHIRAQLADLFCRDTSSAETLYRTILRHAPHSSPSAPAVPSSTLAGPILPIADGSSDAATTAPSFTAGSGSTLVDADIISYYEPADVNGAGVNSDVRVAVGGLQLVYVHSLVQEVIDFAQNGILGSLVSDAVQSAGAAIAETAAAATKLHLSVAVVQPTLIIPVSATSAERLVAALGAVIVENAILPPATVGSPQRERYSVAVKDLAMGTTADPVDVQPVLNRILQAAVAVSATAQRLLVPTPPPATAGDGSSVANPWEVGLEIGALGLTMTRAQYRDILRAVQRNFLVQPTVLHDFEAAAAPQPAVARASSAASHVADASSAANPPAPGSRSASVEQDRAAAGTMSAVAAPTSAATVQRLLALKLRAPEAVSLRLVDTDASQPILEVAIRRVRLDVDVSSAGDICLDSGVEALEVTDLRQACPERWRRVFTHHALDAGAEQLRGTLQWSASSHKLSTRSALTGTHGFFTPELAVCLADFAVLPIMQLVDSMGHPASTPSMHPTAALSASRAVSAAASAAQAAHPAESAQERSSPGIELDLAIDIDDCAVCLPAASLSDAAALPDDEMKLVACASAGAKFTMRDSGSAGSSLGFDAQLKTLSVALEPAAVDPTLPCPQRLYALKPTGLKLALLQSTATSDSADARVVSTTNRKVKVDASRLDLLLQQSFLEAGVAFAARMLQSGLPELVQSLSAGSGANAGSVTAPVDASAPVPAPHASAAHADALPEVVTVDDVQLNWEGLRLSIAHVGFSDGDASAGQVAQRLAGKPLLIASIEEVRFNAAGRNGLFRLGAELKLHAETWAPSASALAPIFEQGWRFRIGVEQRQPSWQLDSSAAVVDDGSLQLLQKQRQSLETTQGMVPAAPTAILSAGTSTEASLESLRPQRAQLFIDCAAVHPLEAILDDQQVKHATGAIAAWVTVISERVAQVHALLPASTAAPTPSSSVTAGAMPVPSSTSFPEAASPVLGSVARCEDLFIRLRIADVRLSFVLATLQRGREPFVRLVAADLGYDQASTTLALLASGGAAGPTPTTELNGSWTPLGSRSDIAITASILHIFDVVNSKRAGFGLLATSLPHQLHGLQAVAKRPPQDQPALLSRMFHKPFLAALQHRSSRSATSSSSDGVAAGDRDRDAGDAEAPSTPPSGPQVATPVPSPAPLHTSSRTPGLTPSAAAVTGAFTPGASSASSASFHPLDEVIGADDVPTQRLFDVRVTSVSLLEGIGKSALAQQHSAVRSTPSGDIAAGSLAASEAAGAGATSVSAPLSSGATSVATAVSRGGEEAEGDFSLLSMSQLRDTPSAIAQSTSASSGSRRNDGGAVFGARAGAAASSALQPALSRTHVGVQANAFHIEWNADTVAALMQFIYALVDGITPPADTSSSSSSAVHQLRPSTPDVVGAAADDRPYLPRSPVSLCWDAVDAGSGDAGGTGVPASLDSDFFLDGFDGGDGASVASSGSLGSLDVQDLTVLTRSRVQSEGGGWRGDRPLSATAAASASRPDSPSTFGTGLSVHAASRVVRLTVAVQVGKLSLSANKELQNKRVACAAFRNAVVFVSIQDEDGASRRNGSTIVAGHLGDVALFDTATHGTLYPKLLQKDRQPHSHGPSSHRQGDAAGLHSSGATLIKDPDSLAAALSPSWFGQHDRACEADDPSVPAPAIDAPLAAFAVVIHDDGCDVRAGTTVDVRLERLRIVYLRHQVDAFIDFIMKDITGAFTSRGASSGSKDGESDKSGKEISAPSAAPIRASAPVAESAASAPSTAGSASSLPRLASTDGPAPAAAPSPSASRPVMFRPQSSFTQLNIQVLEPFVIVPVHASSSSRIAASIGSLSVTSKQTAQLVVRDLLRPHGAHGTLAAIALSHVRRGEPSTVAGLAPAPAPAFATTAAAAASRKPWLFNLLAVEADNVTISSVSEVAAAGQSALAQRDGAASRRGALAGPGLSSCLLVQKMQQLRFEMRSPVALPSTVLPAVGLVSPASAPSLSSSSSSSGAAAGGVALNPAAGLPRVASPAALLEHAHAHATRMRITVPPVHVLLDAERAAVLMGVIQRNVAAPPPEGDSVAAACLLTVPSIDELPAERNIVDTGASRCSSCRNSQFGPLVSRHLCERCGSTVCLQCMAGPVYDSQAHAAKQVCRGCLAALNPDWRLSAAVAAPAADGGTAAAVSPAPPSATHLEIDLPEVSVQLLKPLPPRRVRSAPTVRFALDLPAPMPAAARPFVAGTGVAPATPARPGVGAEGSVASAQGLAAPGHSHGMQGIASAYILGGRFALRNDGALSGNSRMSISALALVVQDDRPAARFRVSRLLLGVNRSDSGLKLPAAVAAALSRTGPLSRSAALPLLRDMPAQLSLSIDSKASGATLIRGRLRGTDIYPDAACLAEIGGFFESIGNKTHASPTEEGKAGPSATATATATTAAMPGSTTSAPGEPSASSSTSAAVAPSGPPAPLSREAQVTPRQPPSLLSVEVAVERPRLLLMENPRSGTSRVLVVTCVANVRAKKAVQPVQDGLFLACSDIAGSQQQGSPGAAAAASAPSPAPRSNGNTGVTASLASTGVHRFRSQRCTQTGTLSLSEVEAYVTRLVPSSAASERRREEEWMAALHLLCMAAAGGGDAAQGRAYAGGAGGASGLGLAPGLGGSFAVAGGSALPTSGAALQATQDRDFHPLQAASSSSSSSSEPSPTHAGPHRRRIAANVESTSFTSLTGPRLGLLAPFAFSLSLDRSDVAIVSADWQRYQSSSFGQLAASGSTSSSAAYAALLAVRRLPRKRTRIALDTESSLRLTAGHSEVSLALRIAAFWQRAADADAGAADEEGSGDDRHTREAMVTSVDSGLTNANANASANANANANASASGTGSGRFVCVDEPLPSRDSRDTLRMAGVDLLMYGSAGLAGGSLAPYGWHEDDYEVLFPAGCAAGLTLEDNAIEVDGQRIDAAYLTVRLADAQQATPSNSGAASGGGGSAPAASTAPPPSYLYDAGSGRRLHGRYPAVACQAVRDGDILTAVNGESLLGMTREQATVKLQAAAVGGGPRLMRFRALPWYVRLNAERGVQVLAINSLHGQREPLLRLALSGLRISLKAHALPPSDFHDVTDAMAFDRLPLSRSRRLSLLDEDSDGEADASAAGSVAGGYDFGDYDDGSGEVTGVRRHPLLTDSFAAGAPGVFVPPPRRRHRASTASSTSHTFRARPLLPFRLRARRPAPEALVAAASLRLSVDVFNRLNGSWEPLLEPWKLSLSASMLDFYSPPKRLMAGTASSAGGYSATSSSGSSSSSTAGSFPVSRTPSQMVSRGQATVGRDALASVSVGRASGSSLAAGVAVPTGRRASADEVEQGLEEEAAPPQCSISLRAGELRTNLSHAFVAVLAPPLLAAVQALQTDAAAGGGGSAAGAEAAHDIAYIADESRPLQEAGPPIVPPVPLGVVNEDGTKGKASASGSASATSAAAAATSGSAGRSDGSADLTGALPTIPLLAPRSILSRDLPFIFRNETGVRVALAVASNPASAYAAATSAQASADGSGRGAGAGSASAAGSRSSAVTSVFREGMQGASAVARAYAERKRLSVIYSWPCGQSSRPLGDLAGTDASSSFESAARASTAIIVPPAMEVGFAAAEEGLFGLSHGAQARGAAGIDIGAPVNLVATIFVESLPGQLEVSGLDRPDGAALKLDPVYRDAEGRLLGGTRFPFCLQVSVVGGHRVLTLRSTLQVHNYTRVDMQVIMHDLPSAAAAAAGGAPGAQQLPASAQVVGVVKARSTMAVPVPDVRRPCLRVRPLIQPPNRPASQSRGGVTSMSMSAFDGSTTLTPAASAPSPAGWAGADSGARFLYGETGYVTLNERAAGFAGSAAICSSSPSAVNLLSLPLPGVDAFAGVASSDLAPFNVVARVDKLAGGAYTRVTLHAPARLTNLLACRIGFEAKSNQLARDTGCTSGGYLGPGESVDIHSFVPLPDVCGRVASAKSGGAVPLFSGSQTTNWTSASPADGAAVRFIGRGFHMPAALPLPGLAGEDTLLRRVAVKVPAGGTTSSASTAASVAGAPQRYLDGAFDMEMCLADVATGEPLTRAAAARAAGIDPETGAPTGVPPPWARTGAAAAGADAEDYVVFGSEDVGPSPGLSLGKYGFQLQLTLFASHWIVNTTRLPMLFAECDKEGSFRLVDGAVPQPLLVVARLEDAVAKALPGTLSLAPAALLAGSDAPSTASLSASASSASFGPFTDDASAASAAAAAAEARSAAEVATALGPAAKPGGDEAEVLPIATPYIFMFAPTGDPAKARIAASVHGGSWSVVPWDVSHSAAAQVDFLLAGSRPGAEGGEGVEVVVEVASAPAPFHRTRVVTVRPRVFIVNATGQQLFWRQAQPPDVPDEVDEDGVPRSVRPAGSFALTERTVPPFSLSPLWWERGKLVGSELAAAAKDAAAGAGASGDAAGGAGSSASGGSGGSTRRSPVAQLRSSSALIQLSPECACGGWSPPLPVSAAAAAEGGTGRLPVLVPLGTAYPRFVSTAAGLAPLGAAVLGVHVTPNPSVRGSLLVVVSLQTHPVKPVRPPIYALTASGPGAAHDMEALSRAYADDVMAEELSLPASPAPTPVSAPAAVAHTPGAAKGAVSSGGAGAAAPPPLRLPETGPPRFTALPYLAAVNMSRFTLAFVQMGARSFAPAGAAQLSETRHAAEARLGDILRRHGSLAPDLTRASPAAVASWHHERSYLEAAALSRAAQFVPARSVVPLGYVDPSPDPSLASDAAGRAALGLVEAAPPASSADRGGSGFVVVSEGSAIPADGTASDARRRGSGTGAGAAAAAAAFARDRSDSDAGSGGNGSSSSSRGGSNASMAFEVHIVDDTAGRGGVAGAACAPSASSCFIVLLLDDLCRDIVTTGPGGVTLTFRLHLSGNTRKITVMEGCSRRVLVLSSDAASTLEPAGGAIPSPVTAATPVSAARRPPVAPGALVPVGGSSTSGIASAALMPLQATAGALRVASRSVRLNVTSVARSLAKQGRTGGVLVSSAMRSAAGGLRRLVDPSSLGTSDGRAACGLLALVVDAEPSAEDDLTAAAVDAVILRAPLLFGCEMDAHLAAALSGNDAGASTVDSDAAGHSRHHDDDEEASTAPHLHIGMRSGGGARDTGAAKEDAEAAGTAGGDADAAAAALLAPLLGEAAARRGAPFRLRTWRTALRIRLESLHLSLIDSRPAELIHVTLAGLEAAIASERHRSSLSLSLTSAEVLHLDDDALFPVVARCPVRLPESTIAASAGSSAVLRHPLLHGPALCLHMEAAADLLALNTGSSASSGADAAANTGPGGGSDHDAEDFDEEGTLPQEAGRGEFAGALSARAAAAAGARGGLHGAVVRRLYVGLAPLRASLSLAFALKALAAVQRSQRLVSRELAVSSQRAGGLVCDVDFPPELLPASATRDRVTAARALRSVALDRVLAGPLLRALTREVRLRETQAGSSSSSGGGGSAGASLSLAPLHMRQRSRRVRLSTLQEAIVGLVRERTSVSLPEASVFVQRSALERLVAIIDVERGGRELDALDAVARELALPPAFDTVALLMRAVSLAGAELTVPLPAPRRFATLAQWQRDALAALVGQGDKLLLPLLTGLSVFRPLMGLGAGTAGAVSGVVSGDLTRATAHLGNAVGSVIGGVAALGRLGAAAAGAAGGSDRAPPASEGRKVTGFFDGLAKAGGAIGSGLLRGVGAVGEGIVSGTLVGTAGGMVKGLSSVAGGIVGGASKALEGVSAGISTPTVAASRDDSFTYVRRAMHGRAHVLRPYSEADARAAALLKLVRRGRSGDVAVGAFLCAAPLANGYLVVLTDTALLTSDPAPVRASAGVGSGPGASAAGDGGVSARGSSPLQRLLDLSDVATAALDPDGRKLWIYRRAGPQPSRGSGGSAAVPPGRSDVPYCLVLDRGGFAGGSDSDSDIAQAFTQQLLQAVEKDA